MSDSMIDACNPLTNKRNTKAKLTFNHCTIWQGKQGKIIIAPHSTVHTKIFYLWDKQPNSSKYNVSMFYNVPFWKFSFEVAFIFYVFIIAALEGNMGFVFFFFSFLFFFPLTWRATWSENECEKKNE